MMWSLDCDEHGVLVSEDLSVLDLKDAATWLSSTASEPTLSIAASVKGVAKQSTAALFRYEQLHKLEDKYPGWMLLKVLLAEVHYLLFDKAGAQQRLLHVQDALGHGKDEKLDRAVLELSKLIEEEEDGDEDDEEVEVTEGMRVICYARPPTFSSVPCSWSVDEIRQKWQTQTEAARAEYSRYAAVSTNVLEGVFSLDDHCSSRLVKRGFDTNLIESIPATSHIDEKAKIVQTLEITQSCLEYLISAAAAAFDESMIQDLHGRLMEVNNISRDEDEDGQVFAALLPCGSYRRAPCYTTNDDNLETRFCPWRLVPAEMQWFFEQAQQAMADESADPFLVSAWLHFAFISIHPFADGNGRVGRMISSIPLVKAGLPPVVVAPERKPKYFAALTEARGSDDLLGLASFLKGEVELAIIHIATLDDV